MAGAAYNIAPAYIILWILDIGYFVISIPDKELALKMSAESSKMSAESSKMSAESSNAEGLFIGQKFK